MAAQSFADRGLAQCGRIEGSEHPVGHDLTKPEIQAVAAGFEGWAMKHWLGNWR